MAILKCKMCGGDLSLHEGSSLTTCEYCGSVQTVPSADNDKKLTLFSRANRLRFNCEFDKAAGVYEAIVADFEEEAEAYWGLVLCKYGIEYVDDPATGKKIPTCHRSSFKSVLEDTDFELALENADDAAKKVYREEAKNIEKLRKGIVEVSAKEEPYDIFICYKETDENGERTLDSVLAQDIYEELTEKNYRVFFARITLEDKLGQEYEPYIFAALNSAKVMLVVGTDYVYFDAVWVKNEWSRYLKLMAEDHTKHLIPCYKGVDAYDMPKEFAKLQAQDLGKLGAMQDLLRGIEKLMVAPTSQATISKGAEIGTLLQLGSESLESEAWDVASSRFDLALTMDPMCAEAYLGKLMAERKCKKREQLALSKKRLDKSVQYKQAVSCGDKALIQELQGYCQKTVKRHNRNILISLLLVLVMLSMAVAAIEWNYQGIVDAYHNEAISASDAYDKLSAWAWYRQPDTYTQYMLERDIPGVYPLVKNAENWTLPKGIERIKNNAFKGCADMVRVTIPDSVIAIGDRAFDGCTALANIEIPESVRSIGDGAFSNCTNLTSVTLPSGITVINDRSFIGCTSLREITIPGDVTRIGQSAFDSCKSLKSITIPNGVTDIDKLAFYNCVELVSVTIPASVKTIEKNAFKGCQLQEIWYEGSEADRANIKIEVGNESLNVTWHYKE